MFLIRLRQIVNIVENLKILTLTMSDGSRRMKE